MQPWIKIKQLRAVIKLLPKLKIVHENIIIMTEQHTIYWFHSYYQESMHWNFTCMISPLIISHVFFSSIHLGTSQMVNIISWPYILCGLVVRSLQVIGHINCRTCITSIDNTTNSYQLSPPPFSSTILTIFSYSKFFSLENSQLLTCLCVYIQILKVTCILLR